MSNVNAGRPRPHRQRLSEDMKRVQVCMRIAPSTAKFINNLMADGDRLKFKNMGRAIDAIVRAIQRKEVATMIDAGEPLRLKAL